MLPIVTAPNDVLSQPAKPVNKIDNSVHQLIKEMTQSLISAIDPEGVGLAAPQVGKSLQIFIIKSSPKSPLLTFINPVMHVPADSKLPVKRTGKRKEKKGVKLEGCLSLKDIWGMVDRYPTIVLSYLDEKGQQHEKKFAGLMATIIQHEYDHLQGILFPKHVLEQGHQLYKSVKDEAGETVFEEIQI